MCTFKIRVLFTFLRKTILAFANVENIFNRHTIMRENVYVLDLNRKANEFEHKTNIR